MLTIIPKPQRMGKGKGALSLCFANLHLFAPKTESGRLTKKLRREFPDAALTLHECEEYYLSLSAENPLAAGLDKNAVKDKYDGYLLSAKGGDLTVYAPTARGLFYGIVTLCRIKNEARTELYIEDYADVKNRFGYFDLRMLHPKHECLLSYIEEMASYKANGLIIEYEDKLPFTRYPFLSHKDFAMTAEQHAELLSVAADNYVEIIPLQQCFGHLEYVLKHPVFRQLRECEDSLGELCPSKEESFALVCNLLEEMMEKHPESRYIHVGCDEVWTLCSCEVCHAAYGEDKEGCFIDFVNRIVDFVCAHGKIPIVWHDMLEHCSEENSARMDKRAAVMLWLYAAKLSEEQVTSLYKKFSTYGMTVMGACAVCNNGGRDDQNYPLADNRLNNVDAWVAPLAHTSIDTIVSTNWSASFGMACPYGIYETSLYTLYYSFEKYWNKTADRETYLTRFLTDFHGIDTSLPEMAELLRGRRAPDYYYAIGSLSEYCTKHKSIAQWIGVSRRYEQVKCHFPPHLYAYRYRFYGNEEGEVASLRSKILAFREQLAPIRAQMESLLSEFMSEGMAELFLASRFFFHDFLEEHLYGEVVAKQFPEQSE
ncbi:MAG: family 20 glycosylhydrolase [Clostridia bacterium]|nr:family 20 glycosylhydrolase [Clostridia bacterium]